MEKRAAVIPGIGFVNRQRSNQIKQYTYLIPVDHLKVKTAASALAPHFMLHYAGVKFGD